MHTFISNMKSLESILIVTQVFVLVLSPHLRVVNTKMTRFEHLCYQVNLSCDRKDDNHLIKPEHTRTQILNSIAANHTQETLCRNLKNPHQAPRLDPLKPTKGP